MALTLVLLAVVGGILALAALAVAVRGYLRRDLATAELQRLGAAVQPADPAMRVPLQPCPRLGNAAVQFPLALLVHERSNTLVVSDGQGVRVFNAATGSLLRTLQRRQPPVHRTLFQASLAVEDRPGGAVMELVHDKATSAVRLWDSAGVERVLGGFENFMAFAVCFDRRGQVIAVGQRQFSAHLCVYSQAGQRIAFTTPPLPKAGIPAGDLCCYTCEATCSLCIGDPIGGASGSSAHSSFLSVAVIGTAAIVTTSRRSVWMFEPDRRKWTELWRTAPTMEVPENMSPAVRHLLSAPMGIAVAPSGDLVVCDSGHGRIVVLSTPQSSSGTSGTPQLQHIIQFPSRSVPTGVALHRAADGSHELLVVDACATARALWAVPLSPALSSRLFRANDAVIQLTIPSPHRQDTGSASDDSTASSSSGSSSSTRLTRK